MIELLNWTEQVANNITHFEKAKANYFGELRVCSDRTHPGNCGLSRAHDNKHTTGCLLPNQSINRRKVDASNSANVNNPPFVFLLGADFGRQVKK